MTDFESIRSDLSTLGISRGDSLLIHSSFKSLGRVDGGIKTLVDAILSVIGEGGTLIVPTLTYRDVSVENPVFDYLNTPSCVGAVSEYVRLMKGSIRSIHPTHSCSTIGRLAEEYVRGHENDRTPIGENSPFRKLMQNGGKILMLGCGMSPNTSMHGVEEIYGVSYLLPKIPSPYTVILPDRSYTIDFYRHHIKQNGYEQRYGRLAEVIDPAHLTHGTVHNAESFLLDAQGMLRAGLSALGRDEYFFVERKK